MADFTRPEYDSYLAFCQDLRLRPPGVYLNKKGVWELPIGQTTYFCIANDDDEPGTVGYIYYGGGPTETADWWWLPSLADWLDMLEVIGYPKIEFSPYRVAGFSWMARYSRYPITDEGNFEQDAAPTREEAAAKLWAALNKRAITADTDVKGKRETRTDGA